LTFKRWLYGVALGFDQLGNAICGGNPDETISSRLGKLKRANGGTIPKASWGYLARPLDSLLDLMEPNHSIKSIEDDEHE
jgi:hypothetical protein